MERYLLCRLDATGAGRRLGPAGIDELEPPSGTLALRLVPRDSDIEYRFRLDFKQNEVH